MRRDGVVLRWGCLYSGSNSIMHTIIYVVGLIVVVGFLLSFFGLG